MKTKVLWAAICVVAMGTMAFGQTVIDIPMDQQINVGRPGTAQSPGGDAIYVPPGYNGSLSFETDGVDGWCRNTILEGDAWYYGPYIDFHLAGYDAFDISGFKTTLDFDCRYHQDAITNGDPYADAPIFVRFYTYSIDYPDDYDVYAGYRDYGIVYQTGPGWGCDPFDWYPEWYHVTMRLDDPEFDGDCDGNPNIYEGDSFDPTFVTRMRFYGTDWYGGVFGDINDFVDIKNVYLVVDHPPQCTGDLDDDGDTDEADLSILLADWGCPTTPVALYDTLGFEAFNYGDLPPQDGWFDTTTNPEYGMVQVIDDPTGAGMGKVILVDPPGTANDTYLGAGRLLDTPHTEAFVTIEWDQYRDGLTDNFWYDDDDDYSGWWAIQWDQQEGASASEWNGWVSLTANQWQHVTYLFDFAEGTVTVDVDGDRVSASLGDTTIDGFIFYMEPTEAGGADGPMYVDNFRISEVADLACGGDLDGDYDTDEADLSILLADWGCTWP